MPDVVATVRTGAEVAVDDSFARFTGQRIGVITNPTGVLPDLRHLVDVMAADPRVDLRCVFGPEHGFRGSAQAGASEGTGIDPRTGLQVYDTYGVEADIDKLMAMFAESAIDTVVFDIQDVGARFYTYIWTMYGAMVAAARLGLRFVVLDRPNPLGGAFDGPSLEPAFASAVGRKPILQRHGMTVGELARMFDGEFVTADAGVGLGGHLEVVMVEGWRPGAPVWPSRLPWVPPSPNVPTPDSAAVYVGTCWFEGTNLSEGRGTTRPFELIGAPFIDDRFAERLLVYDLPGAGLRETSFVPAFSKSAGDLCHGVQVHVLDSTFRPIEVATALLVEARRYSDFAWVVNGPAESAEASYWIDKLSGSDRLRLMVDAGCSWVECVGAWQGEIAAFERLRTPYLLYDRT